MYASFFGLKQAPFSIAPDPRYLYMSERHREALAHLLYGVGGGGGVVLLTGEIGAGKTTVCRCFLEQVPENCTVAYIFNPKLTVHELLKAVCDEFGVSVPAAGTGGITVQDFIEPLNRYLLESHAAGRDNVLVIDEAQNLSIDLLEQLRLLTNLETAERKLLQIVLIGQPELRTMLARPELEQLGQRVIARFHLEPLSEPETEQYILHRLRVAGLGSVSPFDRKDMQRIHRLARGVPRRINLLCDRALLGAYAHGQVQVGRQVVDKAAREVFDDAALRALRKAEERAGIRRQLIWGVALASLAALTGFLTTAWHSGMLRASPVAMSADAAGQAPVSTPRPVEPAPAASATRVPLDLSAGWRNEHEAWRALSLAWNVPLRADDVCDEARRQQLHCYRAKGSLSLIRQLERPGLLALIDERNQRSHVLLLGLDHQAALLQTARGRSIVSLAALAQTWRGEFATFWRAPAGYDEQAASSQSAEVALWLSHQLSTLPGLADGAPAASSPESSLKSRLHAFQVMQALQPDGRIGPVTMMKLNRAIGIDEPRLEALR